jgi:hypothetical protein
MAAPPETIEEAAARLERIAPGYLEMVRRRAAERGVPGSPEERARRAVAVVSDTAQISPDAPVASRRRGGRLVKRLVAGLVRFYFLHLVQQVAEMGQSTSWMGYALCDYVAGLEGEVAELRARVERLESGTGGG